MFFMIRKASTGKEWEKFINDVLENNQDKIKYLQKLLGYSLTGGMKEESCYLLYGSTTRNGKSTLVETFAHMLGNTDGYALNTAGNTCTKSQYR